jgi:uncharacterized small protein (DUF1192 family)
MSPEELKERIAALTEQRNRLLVKLGETQGAIAALSEVLARVTAPRRDGEVRVGETTE